MFWFRIVFHLQAIFFSFSLTIDILFYLSGAEISQIEQSDKNIQKTANPNDTILIVDSIIFVVLLRSLILFNEIFFIIVITAITVAVGKLYLPQIQFTLQFLFESTTKRISVITLHFGEVIMA